jgi:hypothetical protein
MIKIKIEGSSHCGKTLTSMRIAAILREEGYDVTVITEPTNVDVLHKFIETPADVLTGKTFNVCIHDTNGADFNPFYHVPVHLKRK